MFLTLVTATAVYAEMQINPDANTLWMEDGKSITTGSTPAAASWTNTTVDVSGDANGGFTLTSKDNGGTTNRIMAISPEYPYLVAKVAGIEQIPNKRVQLNLCHIANANAVPCGFSTKPVIGTFISNIYMNSNLPLKSENRLFIFHVFGIKAKFDFVAMVKEPKNLLKISNLTTPDSKEFKVGDTAKFEVKLEKPAEDVVIKLYHNYIMTPVNINGNNLLGLKAAEGDKKTWTLEIKLEELSPARLAKGKQYDPGSLIIVAEVDDNPADNLIINNSFNFNLVKW
jgi:hypothetical protein